MFGTLKRTFEKFSADEMTDYAASMTYFVMMSLFPALLVGIALLGLLGDASLVTDAVGYAEDNGAPEEVTEALRASLTTTIENSGGAVSGALVFGLLVAIFGASGAFGGAGRALNAVYGVRDERSFLKHKLADIGWTLVVIALSIVALFSIFLGGGLAGDVFGVIGLGDTAVAIWKVARWFVAILAVLGIYAIAYNFAPDIASRPLRWITPGALAGVLIWMAASGRLLLLRVELRQVRRDVRRLRGRGDPAAVALHLEPRVPARRRAQRRARARAPARPRASAAAHPAGAAAVAAGRAAEQRRRPRCGQRVRRRQVRPRRARALTRTPRRS